MDISILGCGRWGSFLAWYLQNIGHSTLLWGRKGSPTYTQLLKDRKNEFVQLPTSIILSNSLKDAIEYGNVIIISINSQSLRALAGNVSKLPVDKKTFVLCMKGLEASTGKRLSQIIKEKINSSCKTAIWVGPGHVENFIRNIPSCMVIDSESGFVTKLLAREFSSELIRLYYGDDLIGNELGAAAKNVMGIAAGMLDGLNLSSLKGVLMARGAREISRLIVALGGKEVTAYGLCHLGDYEATLFSPYSRNRKFGEAFVTGQGFDKLAEGVSTIDGLLFLAEHFSVDLPICSSIDMIINHNEMPKRVLSDLFLRPLKSEFSD